MIVEGSAVQNENEFTYQRPPESMSRILDAAQFPAVSVDPQRETLLLLDQSGLLTIEELTAPELGLAGVRFNPAIHGPSRGIHYHGMRLLESSSGRIREVKGLPPEAKIGNPGWSPDSRHLAFTIYTPQGIELWILDVKRARVKRMLGPRISALVMRTPYQWLPDSSGLIVRTLPDRHGRPPVASSKPRGPIVQESSGVRAPARTYQDLLCDPNDERLFEHHFACQLRLLQLNGKVRRIGPVSLLRRFSLSPSGRYLLVITLKRPFSYLVPYHRFPCSVEVHDLQNERVIPLHDLPLAETIPIGFDAVAPGPRAHEWRADKPHSLVWVEALDNGDPATECRVRDRVRFMEEPFVDFPEGGLDLKFRYAGIIWGRSDLAMVTERWWKTRRVITSGFDPRYPGKARRVYFDRSLEDWYKDPGSFLTVRTPAGYEVLRFTRDGKAVFLAGDGATPEGNRPFLDCFDLQSSKTKRIFQSEPPVYEHPLVLGKSEKGMLLTTRESNWENPNLYLRNLTTGEIKPLTHFAHPWPDVQEMQQELIHYKREDGLPLTARLYLPAGWKREHGTLPAIMWAYPAEFKSRKSAGQVKESPCRFPRIGRDSPPLWVAQGYAYLDNVGMPIVGSKGEEPNDSYVEQLVMNARAAIGLLQERGVSDGARIAVGGHSYGAFMAVNLAAHSNLFAAVIARSGAYNRTLTPFGFQYEERTYWEAPDTYRAMSPFDHADEINTPVLLIHGQKDENSGTHPLQSERLYQALRGLGKKARLVVLPAEGHGYRARESVEHVLWETHEWLKRWM